MLTFNDCDSCRSDVLLFEQGGLSHNTEPTQPLNTTLLLQVLLAIHTQPERWDQSTFFGQQDCGTTMCLAGWTLTLSGKDHRYRGSYAGGAQASLGLTDDEREHLFFHLQTDDLTELTSAVHAVLANRGLLAVKELTDACTV